MQRSIPFAALIVLTALSGCSAPGRFSVEDTPHIETSLGRSILNSNRLSQATRQILQLGSRGEGEVSVEAATPEQRVALAEYRVSKARTAARRSPTEGMALYLAAAEVCYPAIAAGTESASLRELYNLACAEVAQLAQRVGGDGAWRVEGEGRAYQLQLATGAHRVAPGRFDSLTPTARVDQGDLEDVGGDISQAGVGGSLVGYIPKQRMPDDPRIAPEGMSMPLNCVLEFGDGSGEVRMSLYDMNVEDDVTVAGRHRKLAADFAAPVSKIAANAPRGNLGVRAMLRPEKYKGGGGLFFLEPFREDKIPLVFVHGLFSAPRTWRASYTPFVRDEKLRENYQIWIYRYPTGYGLGETTRTFREHLRETMARYNPDGSNPALNQTVLIGHSMGGLLSSAMIRSSGDRIWDQVFDVPIDELDVDESTREEFRAAAYFDAQPYIKRVVFMATPHRGAEMTEGALGRFGAKIIKIPSNLFQLKRPGVLEGVTEIGRGWLDDSHTSIESLNPDSWRLKLLNDLPIREGVIYHSIIGDRGKGDTPDSSDGMVPYWSSHLEGAVSEVIVPSGHSVQRHPEGQAEMRRILHEHLDAVGR